MKNLNEYISNDMKSSKTSLIESLLDDEDDLLDASDEAVAKASSIGEKYKIKYIEPYWVYENVDKKALKKYSTPWKQTDFNTWTRTSNRPLLGHGKARKPNKFEILLCNILLGFNINDLEDALNGDEEIKKGEIYDFFQNIFQKFFDNSNLTIKHPTIVCHKSKIGGPLKTIYLSVLAGPEASLKICLSEKYENS